MCVFPKGEKSPLQVKKSLPCNSLIKHWGMQGNWSTLYRDGMVLNLAFNLFPCEICTWTSDWDKKKWHVQIIIVKDVGIIVVFSHENIYVPRKSHCKLMTLGLHIGMVISFWSFPRLHSSIYIPDCCIMQRHIWIMFHSEKKACITEEGCGHYFLKNAYTQ